MTNHRSSFPLTIFAIAVIGGIAALGITRIRQVVLPAISTGASKTAVVSFLDAPSGERTTLPTASPAVEAAAKLEDAMVTVHTTGKPVAMDSPFEGSPFFNDPFFKQFFGDNNPFGTPDGGQEQYVPKGAGSGVIISPDGYIITNDHVVRDTTRVTVDIDGKAEDARVLGTDPVTDIAVVKVDNPGRRLPAAPLGNSDSIRVGDWAVAVGNPLDVGTTVTLGIISAVNRHDLSAEGHPLAATIQTDAAINPGNSGGALANSQGEVIGINEAIMSPTGSYVGIGFAIPINTARWAAIRLIKYGKIIRPYLGVAFAPLASMSTLERHQLGIKTTGSAGVVVQHVYPGSPAAGAGIKQGDVILKADGNVIDDPDTLNSIIATHQVGDTITLAIQRGGRPITIAVKLRVRPATYGLDTTPQVGP